ncbi:hypothetical protein CC56_3226, partial [Bordetella pertussis H934]
MDGLVVLDISRVLAGPLAGQILGDHGANVIKVESFNTSGGLGTLPQTLLGKARNVDYKSIRYPGHCAIMKLLLNDLRLRERRDLLQEILESAIPSTDQDVIVILASASG